MILMMVSPSDHAPLWVWRGGGRHVPRLSHYSGKVMSKWFCCCRCNYPHWGIFEGVLTRPCGSHLFPEKAVQQ